MSALLVITLALTWIALCGACLFLLFYNLHLSQRVLARLNATLMNRRLLLRVAFAGVVGADDEMRSMIRKLRVSSVFLHLVLIALGALTFWPFAVVFLPMTAGITVVGMMVSAPVEMPEGGLS